MFRKRYVLVGSGAISINVSCLFDMVCSNEREFIEYVTSVHSYTEEFHFFIICTNIENLANDPILQYGNVKNVYVICLNNSETKRLKIKYELKNERIQCLTIYDLLNQYAFCSMHSPVLNPIQFDRHMIEAIVSSIKNLISRQNLSDLKKLDHILKNLCQFKTLFKPPKSVTSNIICQSCRSTCFQFNKLDCGHDICMICHLIRKSCFQCPALISRQNILPSTILENELENAMVRCENCKWDGTLEEYKVHFEQDKCFLRIPIILNREMEQTIHYRNSQNSQIDSVTFRSDDSQSCISSNGTCLWQVEDISSLIENQPDNTTKAIFSSPFYLYPNGYKMCLKLRVNPDVLANLMYLLLYCIVMRDENDQDLQWPLNFEATYHIIDQSPENNEENNNHISEYCRPKSISDCFDRPKYQMNEPYRIGKCLSIEELRKHRHQYIQNDRMFILFHINFLSADPNNSLTTNNLNNVSNDEEHNEVICEDLSSILCI